MKYSKRIIIAILVMCTLFSSVLADTYNIIDNRKYVIRNVYEIINDGKSPVYNISIKVLTGADTNSLYQKLLDIQVDPGVSYVEIDDWGNTYAKVDIMSLNPGNKINIVVDKTIENSGISFDKSIYKMNVDYSEYLNNPSNYKYILPGEKTESNAVEIKQKALEIAKTGTIMEKAKRIYDFVNLHVYYDNNPLYANKGALSSLLTGRGVCDEYAFLFTALCRAAGIPSRVVAGYWIENEFIEDEWIDVSSDRHSWSEFYIPGIGWIPAEPTFMYTYNGKRVPNENYFANIISDDRHFINNYISKDIKKDLDVQYSHYELDTANLVLKSKEESIKLLYEDSKTQTKVKLLDIDDNWAVEYITALYNDGIIYPKEGSLYKPYDNITRAEFAAYIVNTIGLQQIKSPSKYRDVSFENPFAGHINAATEAGLIQGFNGYYNPDKNITRQDVSIIMKRAIDYLNVEEDAYYMPEFIDKHLISDYALESIKLMYKLNIMKGKPGNIFAPKDFTSRAEASKIIWEFREVLFEK